MAQRTLVQLIDDLDGGEATQTVRFAVDGTNFEMDLSDDNATAFHAAVEPYVTAARRIGRNVLPMRGRSHASAAPTGTNVEEVRAWARANGYEVAERGRISRAVMDAFRAGVPATAPEPPQEQPQPQQEQKPKGRGGRRRAASADEGNAEAASA